MAGCSAGHKLPNPEHLAWHMRYPGTANANKINPSKQTPRWLAGHLPELPLPSVIPPTTIS